MRSATCGMLVGLDAARGDRGQADAQAWRVERLARVERDGVGVESRCRQRSSARAAGWPPTSLPVGVEVDEDQVVVGAAGHRGRGRARSRASARARALATIWLGVVAEARLQRPHAARRRCRRWCGSAGRPAGRGTRPCRSRRRVGLAEDQAAARAAEGLVRGGGDDVGVADRARVRAAGDQAGDVRDVGRRGTASDLARDRGEAGEVELARGGRVPTAEDQLGALRPGARLADLVEVDAAGRRGARRTARAGTRCRWPTTFQPWVR